MAYNYKIKYLKKNAALNRITHIKTETNFDTHDSPIFQNSLPASEINNLKGFPGPPPLKEIAQFGSYGIFG